MIILENANRILAETVKSVLKPNTDNLDVESGETGRKDNIDVKLCDYDNVSYKVSVSPDSKNTMLVGMNLPFYNDIATKGGQDAVQQHYGPYVDASGQECDINLKIPLDNVKGKEDELIKQLSLLKTNVFGGVFTYFFAGLTSGSPAQSLKLNVNYTTQLYFIPRADRISLIYSITYPDAVDKAIAKVFLHEMMEMKKKNSGQSPACTYSVNPPLELKEFGVNTNENTLNNTGFLSFVIMKNNVDSDVKKQKVINSFTNFHNYINYHIKCSKAYFHSRMRARVISLLKILNRAKVESEKKEMKTIAGKTFVRS